ncbi:MAG TPA: hypothetical protein VGO71_16100, partial [Baekduia sp.]|nr:hypothetical protein [Baekduia sp.]
MTGRRRELSTLRTLRQHRWFALLSMTRVFGALLAVVLLLVHRVTHDDPLLAVITVLWTPVSLLVLRQTEDA